MPLTGLLRAAAIAVPVALTGGGVMAQQVMTGPTTPDGIVPGMVLVLLPSGMSTATVEQVPVQPAAIERMVAEQQSMMARMIAGMNAMFGATWSPMRPLNTMAAGKPGSGMLVCQESVSVTYNGHDSKPVVKVSHAGNGCGTSNVPMGGTISAPALPMPSARPAARPRVLEINDPVGTLSPAVRHHT